MEAPLSDSTDLARRYPHLFQAAVWPAGPTHAQFMALCQPPPSALIANVNLVPHTGARWVVLRLSGGQWEIPGGTLEPGEDYLAALQRELSEEAGARLVSFHLIGAWHCVSLASRPYRPHLPFPEFYRLAGVGEVEIISRPANPLAAEQVETVDAVSLETVMARFAGIGRHDLAELYAFAAERRAAAAHESW